MSGSVQFNDVCGKVCVCERRWGALALDVSLLKSHTSGPVIWKGCNVQQTHTERNRECREEGGRERDFFYCFRASFTMNLSSLYVDLAGELFCF